MRTKLLILFLLFSGRLLAQDPQFTQLYANPLYINPAYAGADACLRAATSYRVQWPSIPGAFTTYSFSVDQNLPAYKSGIGIQFMSDRAGSGALRSNAVSVFYAYDVLLDKGLHLRLGIKAADNSRAINYDELTFGDQVARGGAATSLQTLPVAGINYFDVSSGLLLFSEKYWLGFAADHLTQPNQSLLEGESILPIKYSLHGGIRILILEGRQGERTVSISPTASYRRQGNFQQMDLGFYYSDGPVIGGVWYRGIPFIKSAGDYFINDGLSLLIGLKYNQLHLGYSYDLTTSSLFGASGGAHELTASYQFCDPKKIGKKKNRRLSAIPCPAF